MLMITEISELEDNPTELDIGGVNEGETRLGGRK